MGTIRVEFVPIKKYNLGLLGLDHLHIVFEDENSFINKQDDWYVLEGTHDGSLLGGELGVLGHDFRTELSAANGANGDELVALIGTPESRGSRIVYRGPGALDLWQQMMDWGVEIQEQQFPYEGFAWPFSAGPIMNSSSVVASLLNIIGVDVNTTMPTGIRASPGTSTMLGSTQDDDLQITGTFTQLATGFGQDTLRGTDGGFWPEKLYGGDDDDVILWSKGENFVHGGQARLTYAEDGIDTIDYTGAGTVHIIASKHAVEHKVADNITAFEGGSDQLFSIEAVTWDDATDVVIAGEGVELIDRPIELRLKNSNGGRGDELGFYDSTAPLVINAVTDELISIQTVENQGLDAGFWAQSAEFLAGSAAGDFIYAGATLKSVAGGEGDDVLDGRLVEAFSLGSENGYDIELSGGDGDDTLVSGAGYSLATGGAGNDAFVLSTMSTAESELLVEFVIADADAADRLLLPYDYFEAERGDFDGSELMQIRGAPFAINEQNPETLFYWGPPSDDQEHGYIDFVGRILFYMDGADLMISVMQGHIEEFQDTYGPDDPPGPLVRAVIGEGDTEALIRVVDWSDGDLGITFPIVYDAEQAANAQDEFYPGLNAAIESLVNSSIFEQPLEERPEAYLPQDLKARQDVTTPIARFSAFAAADPTEGDDVIEKTADGPYQIHALGGDDYIIASAGGDVIDGGTGSDTMEGGRGNDAYFVDSALDIIIEESRGGFDHVYASVDYTLGSELEYLSLLGTAVRGSGNALRNKIAGNDAGNLLSGEDGDDTLAGNRGNDTLLGGDGGDGYVYELGDGDDVIIEEPGDTGEDVLVFAGQITPEDITFYRTPAALDDLIIRFSAGGSITIAGFFSAGGSAIESLEFSGGAILSGEALETAAGEAIMSSNIAPIAADDAYVYAGANTFRLPLEALLENDTDADGDTLTVIAVSAIEGGAVLDGGDIIVTAGTGESPRAVFSYSVSDGEAVSSASVEIGFWANAAPVIDSATLAPVRIDSPANGQIIAHDTDGDTLLYALKSGAAPSKGVVGFTSGGAFTYTPDSGASGQDAFTILVSDPFGATSEQTFSFAINSVEPPPPTRGVTRSGTERPDVLYGTARADLFRGKDGNDILLAGAGNDTFLITGDDGRDRFVAGSGYDTLRGSKRDDVFYVSSGFSNFSGLEKIDGRGGRDTLLATFRNDRLDLNQIDIRSVEAIDLGAGNDWVRSSERNEVFIGGAGRDTFQFTAASGHDTIRDFTMRCVSPGSTDRLDLRAWNFDSLRDLTAHSQQIGNGVRISYDADTSVTLKGLHLCSISQLDILI
jgi:Ca2+-binding RTX toxin-like protein